MQLTWTCRLAPAYNRKLRSTESFILRIFNQVVDHKLGCCSRISRTNAGSFGPPRPLTKTLSTGLPCHLLRCLLGATFLTQTVPRTHNMARRETDPQFGSYMHIRHLSRQDEALSLLKKLASVVKPIMRKRNWKVGELAEFLPPQWNLLGLCLQEDYVLFKLIRSTPRIECQQGTDDIHSPPARC